MAILDDDNEPKNPLVSLSLYIEKMRGLEKRNIVLNTTTLKEYGELIIYCNNKYGKQNEKMVIVNHAYHIYNKCLTRWFHSHLPQSKQLQSMKIELVLEKLSKIEVIAQQQKLLKSAPEIPDNPNPKKSWDEMYNEDLSNRDKEFIKAITQGQYNKKY